MTSLSPRPLLIYGSELLEYSFGADHPMGPDRVRLALELSRHFGLLDLFDSAQPPDDCSDLVRLVHDDDYIAALSSGEPHPDVGIGDAEHPVVPQLPPIAEKVVGATVAAVSAVWSGAHRRAVNLAGGLHHAGAHAQRGFCMYNDAAAGIQWVLDHGAHRVAYIDLDAHHGDGVEEIFWNDPRVVTFSVHESGLYLFPHTGFPNDIGGVDAAGTAINIALPRHVTDREWLQAIHGIIPPILQRFRPEIIISQHGADPHRSDPLADLDLSINAMTLAYQSVRRWAEKFAGGKWVAIGGGGYHRDAVARAWTQVLATVADVQLPSDARLPDRWQDRVRCETGTTLGDAGAETGLRDFNPEKIMTQTVCAPMSATSRVVFPYWGLQPYRSTVD